LSGTFLNRERSTLRTAAERRPFRVKLPNAPDGIANAAGSNHSVAV